jgi:hypothetical protein
VWTIYPQIPSPGRGVASVSFIIDDVAPATYDFRVAAFNSIGAKSAYSPTTTKEIAGLNTAPSNVANFAVQSYSGQAKFTWDKPSTATDLAVVQAGRIYVRWSPKTSGAAWDNGSLVNPDGYPGDTSIGFGPLMGGHLHGEAVERPHLSRAPRPRSWSTEALMSGPRDARHGDRVARLLGGEVERRRGRQRHPARRHDARRRDAHQHRHLERHRLAWAACRARAATASRRTLDLGAKQVCAARLEHRLDRLFATDDMVDSRTDLDRQLGHGRRRPDRGRRGAALGAPYRRRPGRRAPCGAPTSASASWATTTSAPSSSGSTFATGSPTHNRRVSTLSVAARH